MRSRRRFVAAGLVAGAGALTAARCGALSPGPRSPQDWGMDDFFGAPDAFRADIQLDWQKRLHQANPRLCGSNVQWVDGGDGLLVEGSLDFAPDILSLAKRLGPSVIRYPGGSQGDVFDWRAGEGPLAQRGSSEHFHRKERQVVRLGTTEFLTLCQEVGAEPFIAVNALTRSARDAADWVARTNITVLRSPTTGRPLPKVAFWEIGNEPYLKEAQRPDTWILPAEYARRANEFIASMRAVDKGIRIGIPLRSDKYSSGLEGTPYSGYNDVVLANVRSAYDFVSVHNAYMPFAIDRTPTYAELYASMMASSESVRDDLDRTRSQLARYPDRKNVPIALTEYNALVSIGTATDSALAAPAGALYVADLLCLLASRSDVLMANHWSLIGNWYFGAIGYGGHQRPVFELLRTFREFLQGDMVAVHVEAQRRFSVPKLGATRAASNVSAVSGVATRNDQTCRILVLNKSPNATAQLSINNSPPIKGPWLLRTWTASSAFANPDKPGSITVSESTLSSEGDRIALNLPPCSVYMLRGQVTR